MQNSIMNENKQNYYFFFISSRVKLNCYDIAGFILVVCARSGPRGRGLRSLVYANPKVLLFPVLQFMSLFEF